MTMDDITRHSWAYLSGIAEPPCAPLRALVADVGAADAAAAVAARRVPERHRAVLGPTAARAEVDADGLQRAAAQLEAADRIGARLLTPDDAEWPAWSLLALDQADSAERGGEPLALWVRGPARVDDVAAAAIALVGSRAASAYGEHATRGLVDGLAGVGWSVISGAAYGIDGAAHRAALAAEATTLAILACGIDRDYPAGHAQLLAEIATRGAVVSEYAPGTTAAKHRFLTRNRLVAALSSAVVVVEAGRRSGAANTAAWARKLGRPLGAVPGPVTSATSVGCHRMIADGQAELVAAAADVIRLACPDGGDRQPTVRSRPTDSLTPEQRRVRDAIPGKGSVTIDEISWSAGLEISTVRAALAVMEVGGYVAGDGSTWRLP